MRIKYQIKLNVNECEIMFSGKGKKNAQKPTITKQLCSEDLVVIMSTSLKASALDSEAAEMINRA